MTSRDEWDATYVAGKQIMKWPSSELVSLVRRNYHLIVDSNKNEKQKVLELGFGTGPNLSFMKSLGVDLYGIEISQVGVDLARESFPDMANNLVPGSFEELGQFPLDLALIYDRGALTHATDAELSATIQSALSRLRKGGLYIGIEWFSSNHSDFNLPSTRIDANTRSNFMVGQFAGIGQVHFADRAGMLNTFKDFEILELTEKIIMSHYPNEGKHQFASWNIVARKPL